MIVCKPIAVIPAKAGIQFNQKNGCPTKNLGHDVHRDEYAFYFETVDESTEHGDK